MRIIRKKYFHRRFVVEKLHRVNDQIKNPEVRVIGENGENLGVMETARALSLAQEHGLDLIEVSPLAQPPVCRIQDYNKFKYQEAKEKRKKKAGQKKVEIKGLRLSVRIGLNDLEVRRNQALNFLEENNKVRIEVMLRGREHQHKHLALDIINKFIQMVEEKMPLRVEQETAAQGGKFSCIIAKK